MQWRLGWWFCAALSVSFAVARTYKSDHDQSLSEHICAQKHSVLFPAADYFLEPWFSGITESHIAAAKDANERELYLYHEEKAQKMDFSRFLAYPFANISLPGDDPDYPWSSVGLIKVVVVNGELYLPSGLIPPHWIGWSFAGVCFQFGLHELVKLSKHTRLPDMTLLLASGDHPFATGPASNGFIPPIFSTSSAKDAYDIALPDCYQIANGMKFEHDFLEVAEKDDIPFDQKMGAVIGRGGLACPIHPVKDRHGNNMGCPRMMLHNLTQHDHSPVKLVDVGLSGSAERMPEYLQGQAAENLPGLSMIEQLKYKYVAILDGLTTAFRTPLQLATKQVPIFVAGSSTEAFYTPVLHAWEHYVPTARSNYAEIMATVSYLNAHPATAQRIAEAGRAFAVDHLVEEGRLCYLWRLLTLYAELLTFETGPLARYPKAVTLEEGLATLKRDVDEIYQLGIPF